MPWIITPFPIKLFKAYFIQVNRYVLYVCSTHFLPDVIFAEKNKLFWTSLAVRTDKLLFTRGGLSVFLKVSDAKFLLL